MSFNPNTLNQQFEGLSLKSESKYDEDTLDEAIINGLKGEYKEFCKNIEQFLNQFMKGPKYFSDLSNPKQDRTNEVIPDLNKYQRKIVHKICDLYCITRDYVDVKSDESGSITITKQDKSFMYQYSEGVVDLLIFLKRPSTTLEERYKKYVGKSKKSESGKSSNPFANKKVVIKSRGPQTDAKTASDKSEKSAISATENNSQSSNVEDTHLEIEHKKKKNYEEARDRIMQGNDEADDQNNQNAMKQKKGKRYEKGYDPEFDRSRGQPDMMFINPNFIPMNPVPGLGMPGMHGSNPMPGMGYFPPYMQPQFYPGPGGPQMFPNPNFGGGSNPNFIMPFPGQNQGGQGQNQGPPPNSGNGYYQNFPGLDKTTNKK